jgi:competence protein ComGC
MTNLLPGKGPKHISKADMILRLQRQSVRALTTIDLIIVLCTIALLLGLLLPALQKAKPRSKRINCVSNIKQIGLAARMFSNDHGEQLPWKVPVETGGTMERALNGDPTVEFRALSNEIASAKVLACASDFARTKVSDFSKLSRTNISYFLCLEADENKPNNLLTGDRNITGLSFANGAFSLPAQSGQGGWGTNMHNGAGNIGLSDGSAQQVTSLGLNKQLQLMSNQNVRFLIP